MCFKANLKIVLSGQKSGFKAIKKCEKVAKTHTWSLKKCKITKKTVKNTLKTKGALNIY